MLEADGACLDGKLVPTFGDSIHVLFEAAKIIV